VAVALTHRARADGCTLHIAAAAEDRCALQQAALVRSIDAVGGNLA